MISPTPWDIEIMARTLWGEARGEGRTGMIAVAHVIVNRAHSKGRWPATIAGVCLQPRQFSCWNDRDSNRVLLAEARWDAPRYELAMAAAWEAISRPDEDITGDANHYLATSLLARGQAPSWADPSRQTRVIGGHAFFKL